MDSIEQTKRALNALFHSRKAILFVFVVSIIGLAAFGFTIIILRSAWRGEMPVKDAMTLVFATMMGAIVGAAILGNTLINAIKDEKIARTQASAPQAPAVQIASGDNPKISNVSTELPTETAVVEAVSPAPETAGTTDPETPRAKSVPRP